MGLFSNKEKVPKIPPALKLPELPKNMESKNNNQLPSLPNTNFGENLNQEMVKSAVVDTSEEKQNNLETLPQNMKYKPDQNQGKIPSPQDTQQSQETKIPLPPIPEHKKPEMHKSIMEHEPKRTLELPPNHSEDLIKHSANAKEIEPIFVRIDKFQNSQRQFEDIKKDVNDIEKTLRKVKEAKVKEDTEISNWTNDLEKIKARLSEIDSDIFDQV
jgi:hypothetical protein